MSLWIRCDRLCTIVPTAYLIGFLTVLQNKITSHIRTFNLLPFAFVHHFSDVFIDKTDSFLFPNKIIMETLSVKFEKIQNANEVSRNTALSMPSVGNQGLYRSDFGFHLPFDCEIGQTLDQKEHTLLCFTYRSII